MNDKLEIQRPSPETEQAILAWMRTSATPLEYVEAGNGFADLQFLKEILKDVKVVGLGEATHGTREFFQMKHRLVEFLVTEMGFTHFMIEGNYSACQPLNEYILHGKGDRATALTAQWHVVWDTQEIAAMVDWMRSYNHGVGDSQKISWQGVDIRQNGYGRAFVLDYLATIAPERVAATTTLFDALAIEEEKSPRRNDAASEATLLQLAPQMQELVDFLTARQHELANGSSSAKAEQALRFGRVMQQWLITQVALLRPTAWDRGDARANYMGHNLRAWIEAADPDAKIIAWAYNGHLTSVTQEDEGPNMGSIMREKFGERYYAIGFEFNQGSFQNRILLPSNYLGDLLAITLPPSPPHTLGWYLAQVGQSLFFLKLRSAGNPLVTTWLNQVQVLHSGGWVVNPADEENLRREVLQGYDAFIFVESTTPSRPTPNALRRVANREGL